MTHTVKRGDTLSGIASKYNTTVGALVAHNGIKDPNLIQVGQLIKIPSKAPSQDAIAIINACITDIMAQPSFKTFMEMIENG